MCLVTVWWFRSTRATAEALRIFPFLDDVATIGGLVRERPHRMWLLNVRERKLSGGGSTRRGFLIGLRVQENSKTFAVLYLMSKEEYFVQKYWVYEPHTATGAKWAVTWIAFTPPHLYCYVVFTSGDEWFENLGETTVLACGISTSDFRPLLKSVACLISSLIYLF